MYGEFVPILRYPTDQVVTSTQNGFVDVLDWLGFLCAKDYLLDVLVKVHGLAAQDAKRRAAQIAPHVRIAGEFIKQSLAGPKELTFLPAYYALLNLSKVYVLLGPRHADLGVNRTHGASYDVERKDSQTVLTEVITLHPKGVFPLFYETLTGKSAKGKKFNLQMKEVMPYISGIGHEYSLATSKPMPFCMLQFGMFNNHIMAIVNPSSVPVRPPYVPCLAGFTASGNAVNHLVGSLPANPADFATDVRKQVKSYLFLRRRDSSAPHFTFAFTGHTRIEFPEEVPIWLLFFYMSSVVRYKPESFSRLRDSKYWPPLSAQRPRSTRSLIFCSRFGPLSTAATTSSLHRNVRRPAICSLLTDGRAGPRERPDWPSWFSRRGHQLPAVLKAISRHLLLQLRGKPRIPDAACVSAPPKGSEKRGQHHPTVVRCPKHLGRQHHDHFEP